MPSWREELHQILQDLGILEEEDALDGQTQSESSETPEADWTMRQDDPQQVGVFYRVALFGQCPEVQVVCPSEVDRQTCEKYVITLAPDFHLAHLYAAMETTRGSAEFEHIQARFSYHLLLAVAEMMKALFWQGNRERLEFPPEILVKRGK